MSSDYDNSNSVSRQIKKTGAEKLVETSPRIKKKVKFQVDDPAETKKPKLDPEDSTFDPSREENASSFDEQQSPWGCMLPPEILISIFQQVVDIDSCTPALPRLSRVCRLWHTVAVSPQLWHSADLSLNRIRKSYQNEKKLLHILRTRFTRVKDLSLSRWKVGVITKALNYVADNCTDLRALNLSGCKNLTADVLLNIISKCSLLEGLDISATWPHTANPKSAVSVTTLLEIFETMNHRLIDLNLAHNSITGLGQIISHLSKNCPNLHTLDLSNLRTDMVQVNLEQLQIGCPKLGVLRLTNSPIRFAASSSELRSQTPGFVQLQELSIAVDAKKLSSLDNSGLERIVKASNKLRLLDVRGCASITSSSLIQIPAWDLQHLFLSGSSATKSSTAGELELVIRKWKHSLVELDLSWASDAKSLDEAVLTLAEEKNPVLKFLDLCGSSVGYEPVKQVLSKCDNLRILNLSSCRALPRGMKRLYNNRNEIEDLIKEIDKGRFEENNEDDF